MDYFQPPEIWNRPRPSLRSIVTYAREAPWTGEGLARKVGITYAWLVAVPAHAIAYVRLWVMERPARLVCALVLLVVVALTPPGQYARDRAAAGMRWLAPHVQAHNGDSHPSTTQEPSTSTPRDSREKEER